MNRRKWLKTGSLALAGTSVALNGAAKNTAPLPFFSSTAEGPLRLNSNENPHGPSPTARKAMIEAFDLGCRYPSQFYNELKEKIAEKEGVTPDHIFIGAGSHELLRVAGTAYGIGNGEILTAFPTYEGMERYASATGAFTHRVPLDDDLMIDLEAMDRRTTQSVNLVFLCNPNNPTGTVLPGDQVDAFCEEVSKRAVVFVDEAYHEYVDDPAYYSMIHRVKAGDNIIVSRTFSKIFGLAGIRVGYGIARPDIIRRMQPFATGSGVNVLGVKAALASYDDEEFLNQCKNINKEAREYTTGLLSNAGYRVLPSHTNFVFFELGSDIRTFGEAMKERGILVGRPFPPYLNWCRLSLSSKDDMKQFASVFASVKEQDIAGSPE